MLSTVVEQAAQEYEPSTLQAAAKRIYCWRRRRYIKVMSADMGQKPRVNPAKGYDALTPEFGRKIRIHGLRLEIIELLQEQGPLRLSEISRLLESKESLISSNLYRQPEFYTDGGSKNSIWHLDEQWLQSVIDANMAIIEKTPQEAISDYIRKHGPSPASAIMTAVDRDVRHMLKEHFAIVEPERQAVWGLTEQGKTAELAYRSIAAKAIDALRERGPLTTAQIAERIDVAHRRTASALNSYKEYFVQVQPRTLALWGFK